MNPVTISDCEQALRNAFGPTSPIRHNPTNGNPFIETCRFKVACCPSPPRNPISLCAELWTPEMPGASALLAVEPSIQKTSEAIQRALVAEMRQYAENILAAAAIIDAQDTDAG